MEYILRQNRPISKRNDRTISFSGTSLSGVPFFDPSEIPDTDRRSWTFNWGRLSVFFRLPESVCWCSFVFDGCWLYSNVYSRRCQFEGLLLHRVNCTIYIGTHWNSSLRSIGYGSENWVSLIFYIHKQQIGRCKHH